MVPLLLDRLAAKDNNFTICADCELQFKWLLCEGAFPACGYYSCLSNGLASAIVATCPNLCACQNCTPLVSKDCEANGGVTNANYSISAPCNHTALNLNISNVYTECEGSLLDRSYCEDFVNVCSCDKANTNSLCSVYGSGFNVTDWPAGSCPAQGNSTIGNSTTGNSTVGNSTTGNATASNSTGDWCSLTQPPVFQSPSTLFCPNADLCITVPAPLAAQAASLGVGGVVPSKVVPGTYVVKSPPTTINEPASQSSNASGLGTTPLLLVALVLGIFFA